MAKRLGVLAAALVLSVMLAACGSGAGKENNGGSAATGVGETGAAAQELVVKATNYKFDKAEYVVKKDEPVNIKLETDGVHGLKIDNTDVDLKGGESKTVTLKAGTYEMKCSVPCGSGHLDMVSKLTVQ